MKSVSSVRTPVFCWAISVICVLIGAHAEAQTALPSPWIASDIASPALTGSTTYNNGVFTVSASGTGMGTRSDQFHFVYQPVSGNARIVARVATLIPADPATKVGVIIRSSLSQYASYGFASISGGQGIAWSRRTSDFERFSATTASGSLLTPVWLAIERSGTTVTASLSNNGSTWTTIGSDTIAMGTTAYVGFALAAHSASQYAMADVSNVSLNGSSTSGGGSDATLQSRDIGWPGVAGSLTESNGVLTVRGAGADIGGTSDQFHFAYRQVTGDVDIRARIDSLASLSSVTKSGVMIRASLGADAAHAFSFVNRSRLGFRRRLTTAGTSSTTLAAYGQAPAWLRLVRTGNQFDSYRSTDGQTWTLMGTSTITMPSTVYVGVPVTSGSSTQAATAAVSQLTIGGVQAGANQLPTVSLTSPSSSPSLTAPASISLAATASDTDGSISRVEFYSGTTLLATDSSSPYTGTWSSVAAGSYSLTAVAWDNAGGRTVSAPVSITVDAANAPPTVSLTAPTNGQTFNASSNITLAASASDPEGRMSRVEFYANNALLGSDSTSPYSWTWSSVAAGSYSLTAIAYDANGGRTTSSAVSITVGSSNRAPTVSITSPTDGQTAVAPASFTITASASDPEGRMARVEFYVNGSLFSTDSWAPYSRSWGSVPAGTYRLSAVAVDAEGNRGVSATVNVTVTSTSGGSSGTFTVAFTASADHATNVTSYRLNVYAATANTATSTPITTSDLGKPTPDSSNTISVDRTTFLSALAPGTYQLTVTAIGPSGSSQSAPITFTR